MAQPVPVIFLQIAARDQGVCGVLYIEGGRCGHLSEAKQKGNIDMKMTGWTSLAAVAALGMTFHAPALQAQGVHQTSKGDRLDTTPLQRVLAPASYSAAIRHGECPHCKRLLTKVRVPLDSKERAFGTRYVEEHRCPGCKFRIRREISGNKETRTVMECSSACPR